jgi:hypothetical protein
MSHKLTSKCDGCGVEHVDEDDGAGPGIAGILGAGRRRGTDRWSSLTVASSAFPAMFDLCEGCTKRVVDLLELEIPDTRAIMQRYGGGLGGHPGVLIPGDFMTSAPPWGKPGPASPPFGGLTPEDLKALGIEIPSVSPPRPRGVSCACHDGYKCIPETCKGHCKKCLGQ